MKLQVIVGTTRPNRVTDRVASWVASTAKELPDTSVEVVDLIDYPMPFFDEPISPQYNPDRKPNSEVRRWLDKLSEAEAYIIVTPEYNRSIPGVLKNALDYIDFQFEKKPVGFVSHGSVGGAYSVADLRLALPQLLAITMPHPTHLVGRVGELMNEAGQLDEELKKNPAGPHAALMTTLEEIKWYSDTLSAARQKQK